MKWICRALQRMEAQDLDFEARLRALEGWRAEKAGEERRLSTVSAGAGGVVGGVVAVLVRVLRRGGEGVTSAYRRAGRRSCAYQNPDPVYTTDVMHTGVYAKPYPVRLWDTHDPQRNLWVTKRIPCPTTNFVRHIRAFHVAQER